MIVLNAADQRVECGDDGVALGAHVHYGSAQRVAVDSKQLLHHDHMLHAVNPDTRIQAVYHGAGKAPASQHRRHHARAQAREQSDLHVQHLSLIHI